jgi:tetratricopeptide (TPR) repeat protein
LATTDPANADRQRDVSILYNKLGDVLKAEGNFAEALKSYQAGLTIRDRLTKLDPSHVDWQSVLATSYERIADVLKEQGNLSEALASYNESLTIRRRLAEVEPGDADRQDDLQFVLGRLSGLAYQLVLARDFATALEAADRATSLASDKIWLYANRAHALMFLGRTDEARALYLQYRGRQNVIDDKTWETVVLEDFAELGGKGLTDPLMDEIEKGFAQEDTESDAVVARKQSPPVAHTTVGP